MQIVRDGVRADRPPLPQHPPVRPAQPPGRQVRGALTAGGHGQAGQRATPVTRQPGEPRRPQPAGQGPLLDDAAPGQVGAERFQLGRRGGHQGGGHLVVAQQVNVEIPGGRGQVTQPLELGAEPGRQAGGQDIADELERGPGPPDGDPQVMQELAVDVPDGAGHVGLQRVQQLEQHGPQGGPGGHGRVEMDADLVAVRLGALARGGEGGVQRPDRGALEPGRGGQQLTGPLGLGLVATDRGHLEPGRQLGRCRLAHRGPVRPDPGDRLDVRVEHPQILDRAGRPGHGQQGPDPRRRAEHRDHRAGREVGDHGRPGQPARGLADQIPGRGGQHQLRGPRAGHVLQGEPGPVQPPVEGVQPGPAQRPRPSGGRQRKARGQRGQHVVLAGLGCPIGRQFDDARERLHRNLCSVGTRMRRGGMPTGFPTASVASAGCFVPG